MIEALKKFVGEILNEAEATEDDRQAEIQKFLAAKKAGEATGSGDIAAGLNAERAKKRNMWVVPFIPLKKARKHYPGTFGKIRGLTGDAEKLRFEFHPKSAWIMAGPGKAVKFITAIDKGQYNAQKAKKTFAFPPQFPVVVPFGLVNHNPALKAAKDAGLIMAVTLDQEEGTMVKGHDDELWKLVGKDKEAAAARKAEVDAAMADTRSAEQAARDAEIAGLESTQGDDLAGSWEDDVQAYDSGEKFTYDDEYDAGGDWQDEFEDEFERRMQD